MDDSNLPAAEIGIIGGSGLYDLPGIDLIGNYRIEGPFGSPSSPVTIGNFGKKRLAFLARHGEGHRLNPSEVNYRANIYALKQLGVRYLIAVSACGSLREEIKPGDVVIPDQLFDFTRGGRKRSFFEGGVVAHVGMEPPFCTGLTAVLADAASAADKERTVHPRGNFITIEGPAFSTGAESRIFQNWGMDIIGMTTSPEAHLAREAEICYAVMAHVTDYDVWRDSPVDNEEVVETFTKNLDFAVNALAEAVRQVDPYQDEAAHHALDRAVMSRTSSGKEQAEQRLSLLLGDRFPR
ncbi:MAG: S-methyl-5'-thioadenosine phosphorylase [Spirochaetales bacterium]|nr:S-methyl-5'-thioadenosine phosphorylase [Spirochaetales bacterium]